MEAFMVRYSFFPLYQSITDTSVLNDALVDLLRNETMYLSGKCKAPNAQEFTYFFKFNSCPQCNPGEIILQMARDLAQGMRFLHGSKPPILHGDLKVSYYRK